ncbi:MmcQ/YjbR family DNA-binding protein [Pseudoflavonifractor phocaeensis]|uniref:MmcQ/YjbR family DNA-binding protein n=1 Tax=Pseudoflavonifractor phocaeensis TaxID=1870988 RepID=UPI00313ABAA2
MKMNRYPWLEAYLLGKSGAEHEYKLEWQWDRYLVRGRQFAAICTPDPKYAEHAGRTMVLLKCEPRLAELYRAEYPDVVPGFYSDKRTWNTVYLDGAVPEDVLREMCDQSYALVTAKLTKAAQRELGLI